MTASSDRRLFLPMVEPGCIAAEDAEWMRHIYALSELHPREDCPGYACKICKALTELTYQRPRNRPVT